VSVTIIDFFSVIQRNSAADLLLPRLGAWPIPLREKAAWIKPLKYADKKILIDLFSVGRRSSAA